MKHFLWYHAFSTSFPFHWERGRTRSNLWTGLRPSFFAPQEKGVGFPAGNLAKIETQRNSFS